MPTAKRFILLWRSSRRRVITVGLTLVVLFLVTYFSVHSFITTHTVQPHTLPQPHGPVPSRPLAEILFDINDLHEEMQEYDKSVQQRMQKIRRELHEHADYYRVVINYYENRQ